MLATFLTLAGGLALTNRNQLNDATPEQVPGLMRQVAIKEPRNLYPDLSKFGLRNEIKTRQPTTYIPQRDTMKKNEPLLSNEAYQIGYQQMIYDKQGPPGAYLGGTGRLMDPNFVGNQNRFGPAVRMKIAIEDPRNDPYYTPNHLS